LFRSLPSRQKRGGDLETIEGLVPLATLYPDGCRFADRCEHALAHCKDVPPETHAFKIGHFAACHLYAPGAPRDPQAASPTAPAPRVSTTLLHAPSDEASIPTDSPAVVEVQDLRTHFPIRKGVLKRVVGHVRAVDGVSFRIFPGKTLAVVGESGCGKTTLGKSLLRLIEPTSGKTFFNGKEVTGLPRSELNRIRSGFQMIFQDPYSSLNPRMMIRECIEEGMLAQGYGKMSPHDRLERIREIMGLVGLDPEMLDRYPHEFSGGQRQRIGIARALAVEPRFIVCDEPTSSLDVSVQAQILNLLKDLQQNLGLSYLFITHNLSVVEYLADEVAVMYLGRIVEHGTTEEVFDQPKHPYTKALLAAVPKPDETGREKLRLEGDVPSSIRPPSGCHFHPRCPAVFELCFGAYPPASAFSPTHTCRCFLHVEKQG
jgi:peptide/nickel transport system ATP-binding protein